MRKFILLLFFVLCISETFAQDKRINLPLEIEKHLLKIGLKDLKFYKADYSDLGKWGPEAIPILLDMFSLEFYPFQTKANQNYLRLFAGAAISDLIPKYPSAHKKIYSVMLNTIFIQKHKKYKNKNIQTRAIVNLYLLGYPYLFEQLIKSKTRDMFFTLTSSGSGEVTSSFALEKCSDMALLLMETAQYNRVEKDLTIIVKKFPNAKDLLYHLACIYSIKKEITKSAKFLSRAIKNGANLQQLIEDPDMLNLRKEPIFLEIEKMIKKEIARKQKMHRDNLDHKNPFKRSSAIYSLGDAKDLIPKLTKMANSDKDFYVRKEAVSKLLQINKDNFEKLMSILKNVNQDDYRIFGPFVQHLEAFASKYPKQVIIALQQIFNKTIDPFSAKYGYVAVSSASVLNRLNAPETKSNLGKLLKHLAKYSQYEQMILEIIENQGVNAKNYLPYLLSKLTSANKNFYYSYKILQQLKLKPKDIQNHPNNQHIVLTSMNNDSLLPEILKSLKQKNLGSKDVWALSQMGPKVIPLLAGEIEKNQQDFSCKKIFIFSVMFMGYKAKNAIPILIKMIKQETKPMWRSYAVLALISIGEQGEQALKKHLPLFFNDWLAMAQLDKNNLIMHSTQKLRPEIHKYLASAKENRAAHVIWIKMGESIVQELKPLLQENNPQINKNVNYILKHFQQKKIQNN